MLQLCYCYMPIKHGYVGAKCNPSFDLTWVFVHILVLCNSFTDLPLHANVFFSCKV